MHNLRTVVLFELIRSIKKKSFWIIAISFPVLAAGLFAMIFFSNQATDSASEKMKEAKFQIVMTDDSKKISPELSSALSIKEVSKIDGIRAVKTGSTDAYFYYPSDLTKSKIEVYAKDVGVFDNSKYSSVALSLLEQSVVTKIDANTRSILQGSTAIDIKTFRDGVEYDSFKQMIAPGIFLVLFYFLIAMFGNQMLTSTTEEKENRVIEMILTTVDARTLIVGKIIALIVLAFIQGLTVVLPTLIGYFILRDNLSLPSFDLASIPFDIVRVSVAAAIFSFSFFLFTGLLVAIGAAAPTAKEASGFLGIVMMLIFAPLYAVSLFISAPDSPFVRFLTLFPFTAPIPALLRNAVGNLSVTETILVILILSVTAAIVMAIAIRTFRYGAIEYSKKISLKNLFIKR